MRVAAARAASGASSPNAAVAAAPAPNAPCDSSSPECAAADIDAILKSQAERAKASCISPRMQPAVPARVSAELGHVSQLNSDRRTARAHTRSSWRRCRCAAALHCLMPLPLPPLPTPRCRLLSVLQTTSPPYRPAPDPPPPPHYLPHTCPSTQTLTGPNSPFWKKASSIAATFRFSAHRRPRHAAARCCSR